MSNSTCPELMTFLLNKYRIAISLFLDQQDLIKPCPLGLCYLFACRNEYLTMYVCMCKFIADLVPIFWLGLVWFCKFVVVKFLSSPVSAFSSGRRGSSWVIYIFLNSIKEGWKSQFFSSWGLSWGWLARKIMKVRRKVMCNFFANWDMLTYSIFF